MLNKLEVNVSDKTYPILIKKGIIEDIGYEVKKHYNNKRITLVTDHNVEKIYGKTIVKNLKLHGYEVHIISVKPGESSKSIETLTELYNRLLDNGMTRKDLIIAFGGGVIGDLAGFAASTFLRGIKYIQIPTTLLAQIDSSIGGKVAVNLPKGKNLVGSFYHPELVFIDPLMLKTLPQRYLYDGMAEVIKYACMIDYDFFRRLKSINNESELFSAIDEIIFKCCSIKKEIVERDEKETGDRMLLNFGHTIGHAIERVFNYEKYTHGEAVAIGMYSITQKSEFLGITKVGTSNSIKELLVKFNLPYELPKIEAEILLKAMDVDKKSESEYINLVLLREIGDSFIKKIEKKDMTQYLFA